MAATVEDRGAEFLDYKLLLCVVDGPEAALAHMARWGSRHTESICTQDPQLAERFVREVDAAKQDNAILLNVNNAGWFASYQGGLNGWDGTSAISNANYKGAAVVDGRAYVSNSDSDKVGAALDGGPCDVGIESTIVDLSRETPRVLRPGRIAVAELEAVIGRVEVGAVAASPRVSGALASHYAPRTPAELMARSSIKRAVGRADAEGERYVVLLRGEPIADVDGLTLPADASEYARNLYAALRELDAEDADRILVEAPPDGDEWAAVRDRLGRACSGPSSFEADAT